MFLRFLPTLAYTGEAMTAMRTIHIRAIQEQAKDRGRSHNPLPARRRGEGYCATFCNYPRFGQEVHFGTRTLGQLEGEHSPTLRIGFSSGDSCLECGDQER